MNDLIKTTIKSAILFIGSIFILSMFTNCEDEIEPNEPTCSCYEVHEVLTPVNVNGMPQLQWLIDYETAPLDMPCSSATEYTNVNNTERWKVECQ